MNKKNLVPNSERTPEELREITQKGGIASGKARREKKLLSQIYAEFLAEEFDITIDGDRKKITGQKLVDQVVKKIIIAGGSPAVSMLREIREATEGSKTALTGENGGPIPISVIKRVVVEPGREPNP